MNTTPQRPCPDDEVLQELAAGICPPELAEQTMRHVARCSVCGPALRRYLREFSAEVSPENQRIIQQLESSKPEWQRRLVHQAVGRSRRFPWMRSMKLVPAFGALAIAIAAIAAGPALWSNYQISKAKKLTAAAFAGRRTTEMRLTAMDYSPYKPFPTEMGGPGERQLDEMPPELTSASSAANEKLRDEKADPRWLQIQGRALLWAETSGSLERAEKDFEKARANGLNTPSLEIDLAASYFERDSKADHPNLQRSLNLLNEVLSKPGLSSEDRASALYDLAIAYEKTQAWDLAAETWENYLKVDSTSGWADEAKQRLKDAKEKIRGSGRSGTMSPGEFLQRGQDQEGPDQVEEYQDLAISAWLPNALEKKDDDSLKAVHAVADLLARRHSDAWLADFVSSLQPGDVAAVKALALAFEKNSQGKYEEAIDAARRAAQAFASHKNRAGEFRADIEEVNAYRRALKGADCLARADPVWDRLSRTQYRWQIARLSVDRAECGNLLGAFAESDTSLHTSREIAQRFGFPVLELRDIGLSAGNKHLRGNCSESWRESVDGLNVYWQKKQASAGRLYQFYAVMFQCALETGSLYAGEAFLRHALALRQNTSEIGKNGTVEGMLHLQLANVLAARKAMHEAGQEKERGNALIGPKGLPAKLDLTVKLEPAEFQLEHGEAQRALATLLPLRPGLDNPDRFFSLRFNQALGNTYLKLGQLDEAAKAYQGAIATAESALDGITNGVDRMQWLRATDESYRGLVRSLIEQKKTVEALTRWEVYRSRALLQDRTAGADQAVPVERPGKQLPSVTASQPGSTPRLIYADFSDGLQIWISHDNQVSSQWVRADKQDFENSVRDFVAKCSKYDSKLSEVHELGGKLFSLMVQPVAAFLAHSGTVIIELDQETYNLPMEALRAPDGRYFAEAFSVVYSPGIWMEKELRMPARFQGEDPVLVLDASHAPDAGYLPGLDAQRSTITALFPRTRVIDSTRTSWNQTRSLIATSTLFHYMGHGRPDGSGTSLDYDSAGPLRAKDFSTAMLHNAELAVLAACSGAVGRESGLADSNNLVRTFLAAGVPAVIASRWNVDSASTSQLMIGFYQNLKKDQTVGQAVYNARIQVMHSKPHPYFWAGFTLAGRAG